MNTSERCIIKSCIKELLAAGFLLSVNDGEEVTVKRSNDLNTIFAALGTTDEDHLIVYKHAATAAFAWVFFVYGNEPGVVISDYTLNLERYLTKTQALAVKIGNITQH